MIRIFLLMSLMMTGCKTSTVARDPSNEYFFNKASNEFHLAPQSKILISVRGESELTQEIMVGAQGTIDYAYFKDIHVQGLTLKELEEKITLLLKDYLRFPRVQVKVIEKGVVYILGKVRNPGIFKLKDSTSPLQAVVMAGGFNAQSRRTSIAIIRTIKGEKKTFEIPLQEVNGGVKSIDSVFLEPGDTVVIE